MTRKYFNLYPEKDFGYQKPDFALDFSCHPRPETSLQTQPQTCKRNQSGYFARARNDGKMDKMSSMINAWLRAHRLSRAVFLAAALAAVLVWGLLDWPAPLISRGTEQGLVISASDHFGLVALADSRKVRLYFLSPYPHPGDSVPLIRETYKDGTTFHQVDLDEWQMGHSSTGVPHDNQQDSKQP